MKEILPGPNPDRSISRGSAPGSFRPRTKTAAGRNRMSGSSQPHPNVGRRGDGFLDPYGLVLDASDDEVIELAPDPEVLFDLCRRPRGG